MVKLGHMLMGRPLGTHFQIVLASYPLRPKQSGDSPAAQHTATHTNSKGSNCSAEASVSISGSSASHTSRARSAMA